MEVGIDIPISWGWACAPLIFGPRSAREPQETRHSVGAGFRVKPEEGVTSPDAAVATFEPGSGRDRGLICGGMTDGSKPKGSVAHEQIYG